MFHIRKVSSSHSSAGILANSSLDASFNEVARSGFVSSEHVARCLGPQMGIRWHTFNEVFFNNGGAEKSSQNNSILNKIVDSCLSRKLASASWSPSCFTKVLGGWNLQSRETTTLPPADWFTSSLAVAQSPPGRHRQQIRQHPHPQHHCAFIFFMPSSSSLPS